MKKNITSSELFKRYLNNHCTPEEIELLLKHFGTSTEKELRKSIQDALNNGDDQPLNALQKRHLTNLYQKISSQLPAKEDVQGKLLPFYKRKSFIYLTAACLALMITGIAAMFHKNYPGVKFKDFATDLINHDIPPGGSRAVLTLANGKTITLNEAADGELVKEAGIVVRKTGHGQLVYEVAGDNGDNGTLNYNTISTPKGGTYQIILPDGTKVWLNAASELRFPTSFVSVKERRIELSGEAYFEVAKINIKTKAPGTVGARMPFIVSTDKQEVEVLGTHFNVNSYADDVRAKTTLLEGAVRVKAGNVTKVLRPGQQSIAGKGEIEVINADLDEAMAWKNGVFVFNDEPLESIMKKVARWYDVEVVYQDIDKHKRFGGSVSRFDHVSKVLRQLELTGGVHFKIEEGRITAMK
uniref:FecR family protein n=1 Tax=Pedobacter schmidteae TaxID=2201271 RepID=UPI000EAEC396|nr:FecR family protein [Pedobacter schmidteae]